MNPQPPYDLARITLLILIICLLIAASLWTVLPFAGSFIWAATIVVATWPLMLRVQSFAGGRRWAATTIMSVLILAIFIVPFGFAIGALIDAAEHGAELAKTVFANGLAPLPVWVSKVPLIGQPIAAKWQEFVVGGGPALTHAFEPYVRTASAWVVGLGGGVGLAVVHMLLIVIIVAILYSQGELAAKGVLMLARRLGSEQGERAVRLAGMAVRGVALGVIVTALGPIAPCRAGVVGGRCASSGPAVCVGPCAVRGANWTFSRVDTRRDLALLVGKHRLGNCASGVVDTGRFAG